MGLLDAVGGVLGGVGDVFNAGASIWATQKQLELQKEAWQREDTAVQRRAKDMAAAGVNPLLAVGSAASSSSPVSISAPNMDLEGVMGGLRAGYQARSEAQQAKFQESFQMLMGKLQKESAELQNKSAELSNVHSSIINNSILPREQRLLDEQVRSATAQADKARTEATDAQRNLDYFIKVGVPSTLPPGLVGQASGAASYLTDLVGGKGLLPNLVDSVVKGLGGTAPARAVAVPAGYDSKGMPVY